MNQIINPLVFEEWRYITEKSVPGIMENMYMISNFGRVYSLISKRLLTLVMTDNGYYRVFTRNKDGTGRYHLVHRIVMIEFCFIDNYMDMQVNHIFGDKSDNYYGRMEWVTPSENIIHAYNTGLKTKEKGEDCSYATITNTQAEQIAQLISTQQYSQEEIANIVGCHKHIVGNISTGNTWKFVYDKYNLEQYKKKFVIKFTDEQLHQLCRYFELYKDKYEVKSNLYKDALADLFGIEYTNNMSATLSRIYNHQTRTEITNNYNF